MLATLRKILVLFTVVQARLGQNEQLHSAPRFLLDDVTQAESGSIVQEEFIIVTNSDGETEKLRGEIEQAGGEALFTYHNVFHGIAMKGIDPQVLATKIKGMSDANDDNIIFSTPVCVLLVCVKGSLNPTCLTFISPILC